MSLTVKPENQEKFGKAMMKWKLLIDVIGWPDLCMMYAKRIPPFQDRPGFEFEDYYGEAKLEILKMMGADLRDNGLEGNVK